MYLTAAHTTTATMTTKKTVARMTMMIMTMGVSFSMVEGVGLGLVVEEVDSPTKTIAVIPSTRLR